MATAKQLKANRENAQKSSGPTSEAGKQVASMNNLRHGLTGHGFFLLEWESPKTFDALKEALEKEHQPATPTEVLLLENMVQHYWLSQRAQSLASDQMVLGAFDPEVQKSINNLGRYQLMHERLFKGALHDLLKLRAERRKEQIGFESQKHREANEIRKAETHKLKTAILETKLGQNRDRQEAADSTAVQNRKGAAASTAIQNRDGVPACQRGSEADQRPNTDQQRAKIEPKTQPIAA